MPNQQALAKEQTKFFEILRIRRYKLADN